MRGGALALHELDLPLLRLQVALDAALAGRLDDLGVAYKTARGDRPVT